MSERSLRKRGTPERHIVAMGGGGFSMEPENPLLDDYVLSLARRRHPSICFTCPMDSDTYYLKFYRAFADRDCAPTHLALFNRTVKDLRELLLNQDIIYVGGGNTANMLAVWRVHGVDKILREAWTRGIVLAGISAGALCWFKSCCTDSFGAIDPLRDGLALIPASACPHYDGEKRRPFYHRMIAKGELPDGYAMDDSAAVHFVGTKLKQAISSRPKAKAYRVARRGDKVIETVLPTQFLGTK